MRFDDRHWTWATSDRWVPRLFVRPFARFTQVEAASGIILLAATAVALLWANSAWSEVYQTVFQEWRLEVVVGPIQLDETLGHFITDGLMAIFFFVVGLEIKRELVVGDLRDPRAAALPVVAAVGGMVVPALIYLAFTSGAGPIAGRGWAIPMATDIAFVVGVMALLGRRVPSAAKLFVLALAIADDLGAIAVIAIFYTDDLQTSWLLAAIVGLVLVWVAQRAKIRSLTFYVPLALVVWFATLESGVHATLAGVALGFLTPARSLYSTEELEQKATSILSTYPPGVSIEDREKGIYEAELLAEIATESVSPLSRLEHRLLPWSSFVIVPLFALANAGVDFRGQDLAAMAFDRVAVGITLGLVAGKTIGISIFSWLAIRSGWAVLPRDSNWVHMVGLAALSGIGFTVSLFITDLAFGGTDLSEIAKVGIFAGSALAGLIGALILLRNRPDPV
jgi:Na+:H+ antiporter, NhaA family